MIIFSFDCAIKNLGFCCIEINTNWRNDVSDLIKKINEFYETPNNVLGSINELLSQSNKIVDSIFNIKYMNIFNLVTNEKVKEVKYSNIVKRLKYVLFCINKQLPIPDVVLIEHQMKINDKSRGISRYIEEFYSPMEPVFSTIIPEFELKHCDFIQTKTKVVVITPLLKNAYQTDPTINGGYQKFIEKYSNYRANKLHCTHNFIHFLKIKGLSGLVKDINKLDDVADAFMQAYSWCKSENIF